jgi:hypothetical protein
MERGNHKVLILISVNAGEQKDCLAEGIGFLVEFTRVVKWLKYVQVKFKFHQVLFLFSSS